MGKKILLVFLVGLCAWNLTKLPYYLSYDSTDTTNAYVKHGLEGSINLENWLDGYRGNKLRTPAMNFLAVHAVIGITVLMMMAFSVINPERRRRHGLLFFIFAILLGLHTLPAALLMDSTFKKYLFSGTCVVVIGASIYGLAVLRNYERYQPSSEKYLLIAYSLITLGAYGAGFAEFYQIGVNVADYLKTDIWPEFGDLPHKLAGHTLYDRIPETAGFAVFALWIAVVWLFIPIKLFMASRSRT